MSALDRSDGTRPAGKLFQSQKDCFHWKQGNCKFGVRCKFRHDLVPKGISPGTLEGIERDTRPKLSGPTTDLEHTPKDANSVLQNNAGIDEADNINSQDSWKQTIVCRDWKAGNCRRGSRCRYSHENKDLVAVSIPRGSSSHTNSTVRRGAYKHPGANARRKVNPGERGAVRARGEEPESTEARALGQVLTGKEAETQKTEASQTSSRARVEKAKQVHEKRERDEMRRQWRARKAEEEKQRREAERLAQEKETEEAKKNRQALQEKDAAVVAQYMVRDSSLVTCAAGLQIRNVITGFDLCKITIKSLPRDARRQEIADLFLQQGVNPSEFFISRIKPEHSSTTLEAVVLVNAQFGQVLASGLEGTEFRNEVLKFFVSENVGVNAMDTATRNIPFLNISWKAPSTTIVATYSTMDEAREKTRTLNRATFKGRLIRAEMNERPRGAVLLYFVESSVKISGLPPDTLSDPEFALLTGALSHRSLKTVLYDLEDSFTTIRGWLSRANGVRMETFYRLENGFGPEGNAKVKVQFENWEDAKEAHASIQQIRDINGPIYRPWLPPKPLRYTIKIPRQQYEAQDKQWEALSERKTDVDAHVLPKIGDRGDLVFIEVAGKDKKATGILKVRVECLVAGEKLNSTLWHSSFASSQSKGFFDQLYAEKKVFVKNDFRTRSLRIFGEQQKLVEARQMIKDEVERLAKRDVTRIIDQGCIRFFVREGINKLKELLGDENVQLNLNVRPCKITIKGGEEAAHHLQRLIDEARAANSFGSILPGQIIEKDTCPVCYDDASNPEQLVCGHTYCSGCLRHFLASAVEGQMFPLVCAGNDATCNTPLSIPLIQRFLPAQTFDALVETAFLAHLRQHGQEFKYCTTPDCKQIYRHRADQATLQCPSCFQTICSACDEEAHEGMTCEERRIYKNPEEQERLNEELAMQNGYKRCPQCKIWIEKTEGCNHMTCTCGAHICWKCMGVFAADTIYPHMNSAHGHIYDEVPNGVQMENMAHNVFLAGQVDELERIERVRALQLRLQREANVAPVPPPARQPLLQREEAEDAPFYQWQRAAEERERRHTERIQEWLRLTQGNLHRANEETRGEERRRDRGWCVVM